MHTAGMRKRLDGTWDALFRERIYAWFSVPRSKVRDDLALQIAVIQFSYVTLHARAIYVIAIGIIAAVHVLFHRNERSGGHVVNLALQLLRDLGGHGARFLQRSRLEADGPDARVAAAAIALADAGQVVLGFFGRPGIRAH